jgi:hypothetical protein
LPASLASLASFASSALPFAFLALLSVSLPAAPASAEQALPAFDLEPGTRVLTPIRFQRLALFPVVQQTAVTVDGTKYLTLAEGLKNKLVEVSEQGAGGTVNSVEVKNVSGRPLLLLAGETILGGQQDRIIGKDTIVPGHEQMSVEVYCVEHGRWSGQQRFTSTGSLADPTVRGKARYASDQAQVWQEVAKKNAALKAAPSTGTYRNLAAGPEGERAIKPYRDHVITELGKLPEAKKMVGVIAALDGRVTTVEIFDRPELFAAYRDRLLDGIFIAAADGPQTDKPAAAPAPAAIHDFFKNLEAAPEQEVLSTKGASTKQRKTGNAGGTVLEDRAAPAKPKAIYRSYQALDDSPSARAPAPQQAPQQLQQRPMRQPRKLHTP